MHEQHVRFIRGVSSALYPDLSRHDKAADRQKMAVVSSRFTASTEFSNPESRLDNLRRTIPSEFLIWSGFSLIRDSPFLICVWLPLIWNSPLLFWSALSRMRKTPLLIRVCLPRMRKSRFLIRVWLLLIKESRLSGGTPETPARRFGRPSRIFTAKKVTRSATFYKHLSRIVYLSPSSRGWTSPVVVPRCWTGNGSDQRNSS